MSARRTTCARTSSCVVRSLENVSSLPIDGGTDSDTVVLDASLNSVGVLASHKFAGLIIVNGNDGNDVLNASAINSMPHNMICAMLGALVDDTEAPWCKVFHHFTEK